jgi:hypothetical protein
LVYAIVPISHILKNKILSTGNQKNLAFSIPYLYTACLLLDILNT